MRPTVITLVIYKRSESLSVDNMITEASQFVNIARPSQLCIVECSKPSLGIPFRRYGADLINVEIPYRSNNAQCLPIRLILRRLRLRRGFQRTLSLYSDAFQHSGATIVTAFKFLFVLMVSFHINVRLLSNWNFSLLDFSGDDLFSKSSSFYMSLLAWDILFQYGIKEWDEFCDSCMRTGRKSS